MWKWSPQKGQNRVFFYGENFSFGRMFVWTFTFAVHFFKTSAFVENTNSCQFAHIRKEFLTQFFCFCEYCEQNMSHKSQLWKKGDDFNIPQEFDQNSAHTTYTVNIWGQSEGIEKAILPSVGIFPCNLNVLIDIKLNTKVFPLIFKCNYVFRGQKLCILKVLPLEWRMPIVSEKNWN